MEDERCGREAWEVQRDNKARGSAGVRTEEVLRAGVGRKEWSRSEPVLLGDAEARGGQMQEKVVEGTKQLSGLGYPEEASF